MNDQLNRARTRSKFRSLDKPGTATIYIGNDRYLKLLQEARSVASELNVDIKAADIVRFLIDEYADDGIVKFKKMIEKHMMDQ